MKRSKLSERQIAFILRQAEEGAPVARWDYHPPAGRQEPQMRRLVIRLGATLKPWFEGWATDDDVPYVLISDAPMKRIYETFTWKGMGLVFPELTPYLLRQKKRRN